jgi:hypothetical protein
MAEGKEQGTVLKVLSWFQTRNAVLLFHTCLLARGVRALLLNQITQSAPFLLMCVPVGG